jgi:hypothetical protein
LVPIKKSLENLTYAEDLCESIDLADTFKEECYNYEIAVEDYLKNLKLMDSKNKKSQTHIEIKFYNMEVPEIPIPSLMLLGKNIFDFILFKLTSIKPLSELENALNNMPYSYVQKLLFYIEYFLRNRIEVELSVRSFLFLLKVYETQFSNDKTLVRLLESINLNLRKSLEEIKDIGNYNYYSMEFLERGYKKRIDDNNELY